MTAHPIDTEALRRLETARKVLSAARNARRDEEDR